MTTPSLQDLDEGQLAILEKVEKLYRLAAKNPNQAEAESATKKAQDLLVAYNLDAALVNADGQSDSGKRMDEKFKGGMYKYQRSLWARIADLNFCLCWNYPKLRWRTQGRINRATGERWTDDVLSRTIETQIVGRKVNVISTKMMAEYLLGTIERLSNERFANHQRFTSEAVAYREGMAYAVENKLWERRQELKAEEKRKRAEAEAKQREGVSTSNALTIASYSEAERDANYDAVFGEGWSAKQRAEREQQAAARRAAEEEYTRWAAANPEEARKEAEKAEREQRKKDAKRSNRRERYRAPTAEDRRQSSSEFWQGVDKGKSISIDMQADGANAKQKRIG